MLERRSLLAAPSPSLRSPLLPHAHGPGHGRHPHRRAHGRGGPYASSGGPGSVAAARMAAAEFGPTLLGQPIEIIRADTQNKPDVAGSIARQWYDTGVDAITDLPVTPVAAAVQQVAREKGRTVMITAAAVTGVHLQALRAHQLPLGRRHPRHRRRARQRAHGIGHPPRHSVVLRQCRLLVRRRPPGRGHEGHRSPRWPRGRHGQVPARSTDFSSQIVQAQSSGAKVLGLASVGETR